MGYYVDVMVGGEIKTNKSVDELNRELKRIESFESDYFEELKDGSIIFVVDDHVKKYIEKDFEGLAVMIAKNATEGRMEVICYDDEGTAVRYVAEPNAAYEELDGGDVRIIYGNNAIKRKLLQERIEKLKAEIERLEKELDEIP